MLLVDLRDAREEARLLRTAAHVGAALEDPREGREVAGPGRDARHRLARAGVPRVVRDDHHEEVTGVLQIVEADLEDLGRLRSQIARARRARRHVGAADEDADELRPLLRTTVDLRHALGRDLVGRVHRHDLLVRGERHVGATELALVPARGAGDERDLVVMREAPGVERLGDDRELVVPDRRARTGEALDLGCVLLVRGLLAERARERDDGLVRVVELARIEAADLGEGAAARGARRSRLRARDEHLDELLVLAEGLPRVLERDERDLVVGVDVHDRRR